MKTTRNKSYNIAILSVLSAITFVMVNTPLGTLQFGLVSFTVAHIPVLVATLLFGLKEGLTMGLIFGLMTMAKAFYMPAGALDMLFQNPLVSVLPRVMIPVTTYYTKQALTKLNPLISNTISVIVGNLTNTFLVFLSIFIFVRPAFEAATGSSVLAVLISILTSAAIFETVIACIITVPIVTRIKINKK